MSDTPIRLDKFQYSSSKRKKTKVCLREYYHLYVAKTYPFSTTLPMELGNYIDGVLEEAIATGVDPIKADIRSKIIHIMPDYKFVEGLVEGTDAAFEYAIQRTGVKILQRRLALNKRCEPTTVNWRKGSPLFDSAMFDLVTIPSDEELYVDDWKTGNPNYPDWDQIADYALYMFANFPKLERVIGSIVWLRKGRCPENIVFKDTQLFERSGIRKTVERWAEAHQTIVDADREGNWPAEPHQWCHSCSHYEACKNEEGGTDQ